MDIKSMFGQFVSSIPLTTKDAHEMYAKPLMEGVGGRKNLLTLGILCIFGFFFCIFLMAILLLEEPKRKRAFLNKERQSVPLIDKIVVSHDVIRFRFGLPKDHILGLPLGQHVVVYAPNATGKKAGEWNGREDAEAGLDEIERKYTPVSPENQEGYFDLMLKVYKGGELKQFPDGGKMSQYLNSLTPGEDSVDIDGPVGRVQYLGEGNFAMGKKMLPAAAKVGMIAGGTGLTPMLQLIVAILSNARDKTQISLLFANKSEDDILEKVRLEDLARRFPDRFKLWFTVDKPTSRDWAYGSGLVDEKMIAEHMPAPAADTVICCCGPPPMIRFACMPNLEKLQYPKESVITF